MPTQPEDDFRSDVEIRIPREVLLKAASMVYGNIEPTSMQIEQEKDGGTVVVQDAYVVIRGKIKTTMVRERPDASDSSFRDLADLTSDDD